MLARGLNEHQRDPVKYFTKGAILRDGFGRNRRFHALLAKIAERPVGYALYVPSYETGWAETGLYLQDLFVSAGARRSGVGRALLAALAHEAARRGGDYVWCTAKIWNRDAHAAYRGTGAVEEKLMAYAWIRGTFARLVREGASLMGAPTRGARRA